MKKQYKILGLVFTNGISLRKWVDMGLLDREKLIYEKYLKEELFDKIYWFTYGSKDKELRNELVAEGKLNPRIEVFSCPRYADRTCGSFLYSWLIHLIYSKECSELSIIKSNQMGGAWAAYQIGKKNRIPFLLRTGYTYSLFIKNRSSSGIVEYLKKWTTYFFYRKVEKKLYNFCDMAEVSSVNDKKYICNEYGILEDKIDILTNYVDCSIFCPYDTQTKYKERINDRILFVGRLNQQKNLKEIIKAVYQCGKGLDIYGIGEMFDELNNFVISIGADVKFFGKIPNAELAPIYRQYKYYILASLYEGMPKTLLEAMASGCICLGTRVKGIEEIIENRKTGFLADDTSSEAIVQALKEMFSCEKLEKISLASVEQIQENHSLDSILNAEWNTILKMCDKGLKNI